ncbi:hypothetical protein BX661DRAFT_181918 [Kickxella alabastrina]|uniref:uncharacterized protein n=1 Tax=Kickxella alabastrina TaxID=61397 RepID=UPI0022209378|nr:uncharacterized protein BX661DRAFT_181918 [Kickxella alabastrina]KAI7828347.1 hypothetical protein BX661DRAFT_181918 [Kickxella alabastrina]
MAQVVHIYPPLGALTCVREPAITFRVYFVHTASNDPSETTGSPVQNAEIWTNIHGDEWVGIALERLPETSAAAQLDITFLNPAQAAGPGSTAQQFGLEVPVTSAVTRCFEFTVRWRATGHNDWQWAGALGQNAHVSVIRNCISDPSTRPLNYWRQQLKSILRPATTNIVQSPPMAIADSWQVSTTGASCLFKFGSAASTTDNITWFGRLAGIERHLAFVRKDLFWQIPLSGGRQIDVGDMDIVILLFELETGAYAALMAFTCNCSTSCTSVFRATSSGNLIVRVSPAVSPAVVRVAATINMRPYDAVGELFARIRQLVALPAPKLLALNFVEPALLHADTYLTTTMGYCTWNTFYQKVSHEKIVFELNNIRQAGIDAGQPLPAWVVIDDGWQSVDTYDGLGKLIDIFADSNKFPGQLAQTVDELRHMNILRVGVWHALWGYWGGIDPHGPLSKRYKLERHCRQWSPVVKQESDIWLIAASCIWEFYDEFYGWLRSQGVSFVKVDYQAAFECLKEYGNGSDTGMHIAKMYSAYQDAMQSAACKHFGPGIIINCMSQSPQFAVRALKQQYQQDKNGHSAIGRMLFRNSDDYFPDEPGSHGWHIHCNMLNAVWSRFLGQQCVADWDMFRPGQHESHIHAVSRVLSGGPVYITGSSSDYSRQSLAQLIGPTGDIFPHLPPLIDTQCLFTDMTKTPGFLIASTVVPGAGTVLVSIYNVTERAVISPVFLARAYAESTGNDPEAGQQHGTGNEYFSIHQQSTGKIFISTGLPKLCSIALLRLDCDVLSVTKMATLKSSDCSAILYAACLGDTGHCAGASVVERGVYGALPRTCSMCNNVSNNISGHTTLTLACTHGHHQWNIRARIAYRANSVTFAMFAHKAALDTRSLPININSVRVLGCNVPNNRWQFQSSTGLLTIATIGHSGTAEDTHTLPRLSTIITVCLCA